MPDSTGLGKLRHEHEAIRAHVKLLQDAISAEAEPLLPEKIWNLGQALKYFKDGVQGHIALDEELVQPYARSAAAELDRQHKRISKELDQLIALIDRSDPDELDAAQRKRRYVEVREAFSWLSVLVIEHTRLEDRIIESIESQASA